MINVVHPLLTLLASLTRQELAQQIRYVKAENEILRSKLLGRVTPEHRERNALVKHRKQAWRQDQERDDDRVRIQASGGGFASGIGSRLLYSIDSGLGAFRLFADRRKTQSCSF